MSVAIYCWAKGKTVNRALHSAILVLNDRCGAVTVTGAGLSIVVCSGARGLLAKILSLK